MEIWSAEVKELEKLYQTINHSFPIIGKELEPLINTNDANVVLLYSRRCLEVMVTELCESELKRPRKTEPLKGIIDKLGREEKVPSNIIASMQGLNSLATFGTHPKDFDPEQVKPVLINLLIVSKWYLKYKESQSKGEVPSDTQIRLTRISTQAKGKTRNITKKILIYSFAILAVLASVLVIMKYFVTDTKLEKSIAVLPFRNDSADSTTTYFVDGVMEEVLNNLQKIRAIRVISRTSVEQYRNQTKSIPEIASELGVNYIVEGSAQKYGSSFRLRVQLILADNESHLWAESFQQKITKVEDIFNIQIGIAKSIAEELKVIISPEEKRLIEKIPDADLAVYDDYLKGLYFLEDLDKESLMKAVEYLNRAVEKDPGWAPLYTGLTMVWASIAQMGFEPPEVAGPKIFENLNKALELDPDNSDSRLMSGEMAFLAEWDWEKSEKELLKALVINPSNAIARVIYAQLLSSLQRPDEALMQANMAISLDPNNPMLQLQYAGALLGIGDCKNALIPVEKITAEDPGHYLANNIILCAAIRCKEYAKIIKADKYILPVFNFKEDDIKEFERIFNEQGLNKAYEKVMKHLEKFAENNPISPIDIAIRYMMVNQPDKALEWIEKGFELHDPSMPYMATKMYCFDPLFSNSRFIDIIKKMNLPLPKSNIN